MIEHGCRTGAGLAVVALAGAVQVLSACASLSTSARDEFVSRASCPADRVTVVARPDYRAPVPPDPPPPPDVAADPGRMAVWEHERDAQRSHEERPRCGDMFEVTGCGQRAMICCGHPATPDGRGMNASAAVCGQYPLPGEIGTAVNGAAPAAPAASVSP